MFTRKKKEFPLKLLSITDDKAQIPAKLEFNRAKNKTQPAISFTVDANHMDFCLLVVFLNLNEQTRSRLEARERVCSFKFKSVGYWSDGWAPVLPVTGQYCIVCKRHTKLLVNF